MIHILKYLIKDFLGIGIVVVFSGFLLIKSIYDGFRDENVR
jgi:hypothetical protein